jgi:hypothetical protein
MCVSYLHLLLLLLLQVLLCSWLTPLQGAQSTPSTQLAAACHSKQQLNAQEAPAQEHHQQQQQQNPLLLLLLLLRPHHRHQQQHQQHQQQLQQRQQQGRAALLSAAAAVPECQRMVMHVRSLQVEVRRFTTAMEVHCRTMHAHAQRARAAAAAAAVMCTFCLRLLLRAMLVWGSLLPRGAWCRLMR